MVFIGCLMTLAIAFVSYEIGVHLSDEAEGLIVLALLACMLFGLLSLILLPWYLKGIILLALLVSKLYFPTHVIRQ